MNLQAPTWHVLVTTGIILTLCLVVLLVVPSLAADNLRDAPWSSNVPVSGPDAVPHSPVVTFNSAGLAYAAWHDARSGADGGIYVASQPASGSWTTPVKIPGSDIGNAGSPTIAAGPGDELYAAWISGFPDARSDVLFAWSADGGRTWHGPAQVNTDPQDIAGHPDVVVDSRGNVHLVWDDLAVFGDPHSRDIKWSMRLAGDDTWSDPTLVHPDVLVVTEQARPAITADGVGNVYVIWEDARHGPADAEAIYAARLPAGSSAWEPGRRVDHRPGETNVRPDIAAAPDGAVYAVWDAGAAGGIYSAVLRPDAEMWEGPTPITEVEKGKGGNEKGQLTAGAGAPRVAVDQRGIAYVVWQDSPSGDQDLYAAVRWPGAARWGQSTRVNDDAGSAMQEMPAMAAGGAGLAVAVWLDGRQESAAVVYAAGLRLVIQDIRLPLLARQPGASAYSLSPRPSADCLVISRPTAIPHGAIERHPGRRLPPSGR